MGIISSNKQVNTSNITCNESFNVVLSLAAEPEITNNPTDIVMMLDRSGSMAGSALANLKNGAKKFIDIIDESTDGSQDGQIGGGSRMGIVSFATGATQDTQLVTSVNNLKAAVDNLTASGNTNHGEAFTKGLQLFDPASTNAKVMIMFTDGFTTVGGNPTVVADLAKSQGVTIYCIGLSGQSGIDENALNDWASSPPSAYVVITPDDEELENIFEDLAKNISKPGATNIVITDVVKDCFQITGNNTPTKGTATILDNKTIKWEIDELGVTTSEGAELVFTVKHIGPCTGDVEVNESNSYDDTEENVVTFPNPVVTITCDDIIITEPRMENYEVEINGCVDTIEFNESEVLLSNLGRIMQVTTRIRNVCPNKRVALAIFLDELDEFDNTYKRGMKTMTIPAHTQSTCRDVIIRCVKFVLPEDISITPINSMCNQRRFKVGFIAHYIDYDYNCCNLLN